MMNVINGGVHADNPIDLQEFMIMPVGAPSFAEALRTGAEIFHALKKALKDAGHNTNVGDEGGFAPNLTSADEALGFLEQGGRGRRLPAWASRSSSRSIPPRASSSRAAATSSTGEGKLARRRRAWSASTPSSAAATRSVSIEDGMAEDDWDGWQALTEELGKRLQLVGDDLFVTNPAILAEGIERGRRQRDPDQGQPDRHA